MDWITNPEIWIALLTLSVLEIVLGIDNIVFISVLTERLHPNQRERGRIVGLSAAMVMRILLLFSISWIMQLEDSLFGVLGHEFTGRDLILLGGGMFLLYKATSEIHAKLEGEEENQASAKHATFGAVMLQIMMVDIVFSLDSVITAVGMTEHVPVMVAAVIISVGVMILASGTIARFVNTHPTVKILALSFLVLIGAVLVAEGFGQHISKGYIYFAMAFSVGVEIINLRLRGKSEPVHLHTPYEQEELAAAQGDSD